MGKVNEGMYTQVRMRQSVYERLVLEKKRMAKARIHRSAEGGVIEVNIPSLSDVINSLLEAVQRERERKSAYTRERRENARRRREKPDAGDAG